MRRPLFLRGRYTPLLLAGVLIVILALLQFSPWFKATLLNPDFTQQIQDIYGNSTVARVSLGYGDSVTVEPGMQFLVHCPSNDVPSGYGFHSVTDYNTVSGLHVYEYSAQQTDERDKTKSGKARWSGKTYGYDVNDDLDLLKQGGVYLVSANGEFEFSCAENGLGSTSSAGSTGTGTSSNGTSSSTFVGALSCTSPIMSITPSVLPNELFTSLPSLAPGHAVWATDQKLVTIFTLFNQGKVITWNPATNAFTTKTFNTSISGAPTLSSLSIQNAVWNPIRNEAYVFMKNGTQTAVFSYGLSTGVPVYKGSFNALADSTVMDASVSQQVVYVYSKATGSINSYDAPTGTFTVLGNSLPAIANSTFYVALKDQVNSIALDPTNHLVYFSASGRRNNGSNWGEEDMYFFKFDPSNNTISQFPQFLTNTVPDYGLTTTLMAANIVRTSPPRERATMAWNPSTKTFLIFGGHEQFADNSKSLKIFQTSFDPRINFDIVEFDPVRGTIMPRPEILPSARADVTAVWNGDDAVFYLLGGGQALDTASAYVTTAAFDNNTGFDNGSLQPAGASIPDVTHQVVAARICSVTQDPTTSCSSYNLPPQITVLNSVFTSSPVVHPSGALVKATDPTNDPVTFFLALSTHHFGGQGDSQIPNLIAPPFDVNSDSMVDIGDVNAIGSLIGLSQGQPGFNPRADFNDDGIINQADISSFFSQEATAIAQRFGNDFSFNPQTGVLTYPPATGSQTPVNVDVTISAYTPAPCFPLRYSSLQTIIASKVP